MLLSTQIKNSHIGQIIHIRGRIYHKELSADNKIIYIYVRDDTGLFIITFEREKFPKILKFPLETFILITGKVELNTRPALTKFIISGSSFDILSPPSDDIEGLRSVLSSIRFLYIRRPDIKSLLTLKRFIRKYAVEYLEENGFQSVETPVITSFTQINRQAMRISTMKESDISELDKYLIQKSQFYLEALAGTFGKVYTLTPAFRADHRESNLMLAEFWLLEVEEIISTINEKMDLLEATIKRITKNLLQNNSDELKNLLIFRSIEKMHSKDLKIHALENDFWNDIETQHKNQKNFLNTIISQRSFPRLKYKDVIKEFQTNGDFFEEPHLREKRGSYLTNKYNSPVFLTEFPFSLRHFYDKKCNDDPIYTNTFDLIAHGHYGEIASGSEKEYRAEIIEQQMYEKQLRKDNNKTLQWYYMHQRFGSVPHTGFSIGIERLTSWLTQTENITDVVAFPRRIVGREINY